MLLVLPLLFPLIMEMRLHNLTLATSLVVCKKKDKMEKKTFNGGIMDTIFFLTRPTLFFKGALPKKYVHNFFLSSLLHPRTLFYGAVEAPPLFFFLRKKWLF